jgi:hypothetical protein
MDEKYVCIIESIGGVEKNSYTIRIARTFNHVQCNMSNVESVHVQRSIVANLEVTQLVAIQVQPTSWKLHNHSSIYWGLFVINDG